MVTQNDRELIDEYFHFRRVCDDDEHFLWYFNRNIKRAYPRYLKLVELELSEIPDLVDYRRAIHNEVTGTTSATDASETTSSNTGTSGGTVTTTGTTESTGSTSGTNGSTQNTTGTDTVVNTGSDRTQATASSDGTTAGTTTTDHTGTTDLSHTGSGTDNKTSSDVTEQTAPAYHKDISLVQPQSVDGATVSGNSLTLDWQYGTTQNQSEDGSGKSERSATDAVTRSDTAHDVTTYDTEDATTTSGTTHAESESDSTTTHNTQTQTTHNTQVAVSGTNSGTDESTVESTSTTTNSGNTSGSSTSATESTKSGNTTTSGDTVESGQSVIETEIREKIRYFIKNSISIDWLRKELEVCFMGVYEV